MAEAEVWKIEDWQKLRQKGRTNLLWFCRRVLGYKDVCKEVHGKLIDSLQKFQGGNEEVKQVGTQGFGVIPGSYKPSIEMWDLQGHRKSLILIPRGHLKSTVNMAHIVQWVINYPDVRILVSSGTGDQVRKFMEEIKSHFQFNEMFRWLYPEFVPHGKGIKEFGNQERFTVPCRAVHRKEPTVSTCSVGAVVAGGHFDVIKNDDIVDKENVRTPEQIANVKSHYGFLWPLLETSEKAPFKGWMDVIGTRYDFSDIYGTIKDGEAEKSTGWHILEQSAIVEGDLTNLATCKTLWPSRVPAQALKDIADDPLQGMALLSSQYLMNPIPSKSGLVDSEDQIRWIPRKDIDHLLPGFTQHVTVDLAGMEPSTNKLADNDFTVINHHGFSRDGRLYINRIWRGRYTPFEIIDLLFRISKDYPKIMDFKVSKDHFARVLLPFLRREMQKRGKFLPVTEITISNRISKQQKIKGLQPWFRNGSIVWASDIDCKLAVINEIMRFPKYSHDDILDTTADALEGFDGEVVADIYGRPKTELESLKEESALPFAITWAMMQKQENQEASEHDLVTGW